MRNILCLLAFLTIRAAAQPITACGTTITIPGSYYLTGNLTCTGTSNGITVAADNVTIDLNGFALTGPGLRFGVTNQDSSGSCAFVPKYLKVTNGRISNWLTGIRLCAPTNAPAQLSRASIRSLTISGNGSGVSLVNQIGAVVYQNVIESNNLPAAAPYGVHILKGSLNSVSSNTIRFNNVVGVLLTLGTEQNVSNNTLQNNGAHGIRVQGASDLNKIRSNQVFGHTTWDLADENPACGTNTWSGNAYGTRSQSCIN